jgi:hypothetical protein
MDGSCFLSVVSKTSPLSGESSALIGLPARDPTADSKSASTTAPHLSRAICGTVRCSAFIEAPFWGRGFAGCRAQYKSIRFSQSRFRDSESISAAFTDLTALSQWNSEIMRTSSVAVFCADYAPASLSMQTTNNDGVKMTTNEQNKTRSERELELIEPARKRAHQAADEEAKKWADETVQYTIKRERRKLAQQDKCLICGIRITESDRQRRLKKIIKETYEKEYQNFYKQSFREKFDEEMEKIKKPLERIRESYDSGTSHKATAIALKEK